MKRRTERWIYPDCLLLFLVFLLAANGHLLAGEPAQGVHLYLLGDSGTANNSVLRAIGEDLASTSGERAVFLLGDNVYPRGLVSASDPKRTEAETVLKEQLRLALPGVRVVFVPGNHDWDRGGAEGLASIKRQAEFVTAHQPAAEFVPRAGCPGPETIDIGESVRLIVLDTQWWLHAQQKAGSGCPAGTEEAVELALEEALAASGSRVTGVLMHHPLVSGGPHGGTFTWKDHLFPLRNYKTWLWVPLPILGSGYVYYRRNSLPVQDLESESYSRMRAAIERASTAHPPAFFASGHDHSMQVLRGLGPVRYQLISGAGSATLLTPVRERDGLVFGASRLGYMRVDIGPGARLGVQVMGVAPGGKTERLETMSLR